ncbi:hypothetical protein [Streptomyces sp. NPDC088925]|uniref:hypothetical protein n=1 Tax=Streptomyces sp. NPDC088925 TaxID=3365914 RepID=UPI003828E77B
MIVDPPRALILGAISLLIHNERGSNEHRAACELIALAAEGIPDTDLRTIATWTANLIAVPLRSALCCPSAYVEVDPVGMPALDWAYTFLAALISDVAEEDRDEQWAQARDLGGPAHILTAIVASVVFPPRVFDLFHEYR